MRKRTVYYVWYATSDENQNGTHHRSEPFYEIGEAKAEASKKWETNDYVSCERVREVFGNWAWRQQDRAECEIIEVE